MPNLQHGIRADWATTDETKRAMARHRLTSAHMDSDPTKFGAFPGRYRDFDPDAVRAFPGRYRDLYEGSATLDLSPISQPLRLSDTRTKLSGISRVPTSIWSGPSCSPLERPWTSAQRRIPLPAQARKRKGARFPDRTPLFVADNVPFVLRPGTARIRDDHAPILIYVAGAPAIGKMSKKQPPRLSINRLVACGW